MPEPIVSVIIPVFNHWLLTAQCLESLAGQTPRDAVEVIVVDNGSSDETPRELAELGNRLFSNHFRPIRFEENIHFGPGCNAGAKAAQAPLLFFLNNDTLLTPGWLSPLTTTLEQDPGLLAVSPLLVYPGGDRVQHLGVAIAPNRNLERLYAHFPASHPVVQRPRDVQALSAAALLLSRNSFFQAGGFYEGYRNGFEDLELCCRLREMGGRLRCVPASLVIHLESQSAGRFDHDDQNARLLSSRCSGCFIPDLHRHAREDGYRLALTPWLTPYIALPIERENTLNASAPNEVELLFWQMLLEEPLWAKGYNLLARILAEQGKFADACAVLVAETALFPTVSGFARLAVAAMKAREPELAAEANEQLKIIEQRAADRQGLLEHALAMVHQARELNEPELESLYAPYCVS